MPPHFTANLQQIGGGGGCRIVIMMRGNGRTSLVETRGFCFVPFPNLFLDLCFASWFMGSKAGWGWQNRIKGQINISETTWPASHWAHRVCSQMQQRKTNNPSRCSPCLPEKNQQCQKTKANLSTASPWHGTSPWAQCRS